MKTHIFTAILTALLVTACASRESRDVASTQETYEDQQIHARGEGSGGREMGSNH